jgi:alpha-mannosidase
MKNYSQINVLVPCHSLEDFPTHHLGKNAENLLACWTAAWHPALLTVTAQKPNLMRVGTDEVEHSHQLLIVPNIAIELLDNSFLDTARTQQATIIGGDSSVFLTRNDIVSSALRQCATAAEANDKINPAFVPDFFALGYGFLQVQLMTRQLRYSSNLDETVFFEHLLNAARLASQTDPDTAKAELTACFDLLQEEKNCYYPVQPDLLDLVLLADTTLKTSLDKQLDANHSTNFLMTGRLAEKLSLSNPIATARIRQRIEHGMGSLIGGLENELPDPLLSCESTLRQLQAGRQSFFRTFHTQPTVFMRRRFGLTPSLPGLLNQFNFAGAIHTTLDGGKSPHGSGCSIRWTGSDEGSILALGTPPIDATDSAAFLKLGLTIGEEIDSAHMATLVFAHWPSLTCDSLGDLIRISDYGPLFGQFLRFEEYFDAVYDPGFGDSFESHDYRPPYLKQSVQSQQRNPISRYCEYWVGHYQLGSCRALLCLVAAWLKSSTTPTKPVDQPQLSELLVQIESLEKQLDQQLESDAIDELIPIVAACQQLSALIAGLVSDSGDGRTHESDKVLINTTNAKQRYLLANELTNRAAHRSPFRSEGPVLFADAGDQIVEVAGMGQVSSTFTARSKRTKDPLRRDPSVQLDNLLRNEFFELQIDTTSGGIRSIQQHGSRKNLISQQLAIRIPSSNSTSQPLTGARYTRMLADDVTSEATSRISGSINTQGRLVDGEQTLGTFSQTVRVTRGIPIADIEIEVQLNTKLTQSINHYLCNRLAWKEESSTVIANDQEVRQRVSADWFQATNFITVEQADSSLTLLTGGLPYHRRASRRMIDSLLIVGNEQQRKFRLGVGIDIRYPLMAAKQWMTPPVLLDQHSVPSLAAGWLFHFNCKNILVTWWQPVFDAAGQFTGVQIRVKETEGRSGQLTIRCPRSIAHAAEQNFLGEIQRKIPIDDAFMDQITFDFAGNKLIQIQIDWVSG